MPGFAKILDAVADAYNERRDEVDENAEQVRELLRKVSRDLPQESELGPGIMAAAVEQLESTFDPRNGGFGAAPKFPQPAVIEFLIRYAMRDDDERARTMARKSLDQMANGGIYDQIGGGFHRYAVDAVWLVPHFEKMLYDNAQLASAYLAGYQAFGDDRYRTVAEETLDFVAREMTDPRGGFYATLDADTEGEEGLFYTWVPGELDAVLGAEDAEIARTWFNVTPAGNFEGRSVLSTPRTLLDVADRLSLSPDDLAEAIARIRKSLWEARSERTRPGRDEKVITGWNGMMLRAFADGSRVLGRDDFRDLGRKNAAFILEYIQRDGHLLRSWKDGDARIGGFLEDYALFVDGLLALYRATLERRWLEEALRLAEIMIAEFADPDGAGFFDTASGHEALVARPRDLQDGATPSGNSAAGGDLLRLGAMTGNRDYSDRAVDLLRVMARTMREHPLAASGYLNDLDVYLGPVKEIALAGDRDDAGLWALLDAVYDRYEPNSIVGYVDPGAPELVARLPFLQDRPPRDGRATAYLCEHFACLPPVHDADALLRQLTEGTGIAWRDV
jgi:uncharacterized protein YyaL (SSP411 family)